jgi:Transposase DDE domain
MSNPALPPVSPDVLLDPLQWTEFCQWLPPNLQEIAFETGAFRQARAIQTPHDLLRIALVYSGLDYSLRSTAIWAISSGLTKKISDVAILDRLRASESFLEKITSYLISENLPSAASPTSSPTLRVQLLDATCLRAPGSSTADWRIHVNYDVASASIVGVELTDIHEGEHLQRAPTPAGFLRVADRGNAHARRIKALSDENEHMLVRLGHSSIVLQDEQGKPVDVLHEAQNTLGLSSSQVNLFERTVFLKDDPDRALRLVIVRKSKESTEKERARLRKGASKKQRELSQRSLDAAAYVFLITNIQAEVSASTIAIVYRTRWQIELLFKRMKSILDLDKLRAHDPALAKTYIYGKLILALLVEQVARKSRAFSPYGYPIHD